MGARAGGSWDRFPAEEGFARWIFEEGFFE